MDIYLSGNIEIGMGWHGVEHDGIRTYRWSTGLTNLRLNGETADQIILFAGTEKSGRLIQFYADESLIAETKTVSGWNYYVIPFEPCVHFSIVSQTFMVPENDPRSLGLMVSKIFLADFSISSPVVIPELPSKFLARVIPPKRKIKAANSNGVDLGLGNETAWYANCPSVLTQSCYETGIFDLDYNDTRVFLNPSIFDKNGLYLLARQSDLKTNSSQGHHEVFDNSLRFFELDDNLNISQDLNITLKSKYKNEQFEDPRVVFHNKNLYVSCCNYLLPSQQYLHQKLLVFNDHLDHVHSIDPIFGGNGQDVLSNTKTEKNWTWFSHNNRLHCVYTMNPHEVVEINELGEPISRYITYSDILNQWPYGECRMGSNPILIDDLYFNFFHSSLPWKRGKRRYFMGAYTFESTPPFRIVQVIQDPILTGSEFDINNLDSPLVVFPCGAVFQSDNWLVTFGINDERCGWIRLPHSYIASLLNRKPVSR